MIIERWVPADPRYRFFLPKWALRKVFRGKVKDALEEAFAEGKIGFHGKLKHLSDPKTFHSFIRDLHRNNWVVHCKRPFGGPEQVLKYLGRYTHRVAISNHRLVSFENGEVTFTWRDRAHGNVQKEMKLPAEKFLRRFLLHLLPKGFVRIRNFGFLASRHRSRLLPLCFQCLGSDPDASERNSAGRYKRSLEVSEMRRPYDRGFESICSKVAAAPAASITLFWSLNPNSVMQERVFVCLEEGNIQFLCSNYGSISDDKTSQQHLYPLIPAAVRSNFGSLQAACILLKVHTAQLL